MTERQRLSVVMIAGNEAELLPDCTDSVSWADEIILLDSGSEDATLSIAQRYGAKVFQSHSAGLWQTAPAGLCACQRRYDFDDRCGRAGHAGTSRRD